MIFLLPALIYLIILLIVNICKPLRFPGTQRCNIDIIKYIYIYKGVDVVEWSKGAGRKAQRMVLQCFNGVGSNPVEGRTKI